MTIIFWVPKSVSSTFVICSFSNLNSLSFKWAAVRLGVIGTHRTDSSEYGEDSSEAQAKRQGCNPPWLCPLWYRSGNSCYPPKFICFALDVTLRFYGGALLAFPFERKFVTSAHMHSELAAYVFQKFVSVAQLCRNTTTDFKKRIFIFIFHFSFLFWTNGHSYHTVIFFCTSA